MITKDDVSHFKLTFCDENKTIAALLRTHLAGWVTPTILDVGCGLGDIVANAFPSSPAILLDRLDYSEFQTHAAHRRLTVDFFDYEATGDAPQTLLFSHVLQFLDDHRDDLDAQVARLQSPRIITVLNRHHGDFGQIIDRAAAIMKGANPEVEVAGFPSGYSLVCEIPFEAHLACANWAVLAQQIGYLLDVKPSSEELDQVADAARTLLRTPGVIIPQVIRAYERISR